MPKIDRLGGPRLGHLLALPAGLLTTLSLAPFNAWPAGIAAAAALFALWRGQTLRAILWRGWLFGLGAFGSGISWVYVSIHVHGQAPPPLALLLVALLAATLALFPLLSGWLYHLGSRHRGGGALLFAACWTLGEWLRGWLLTGFPWLYPGYAHLDTPLAGWAPLVGIHGLNFLVALTGAALAQLALARRRAATLAAGLVAGLWLGGWGLRAIDWVQPLGPPLSVGMMQPAIPQATKWDPLAFERIIQRYRVLSADLWGKDIVIWPEAAIPRLYQQAPQLMAELDARARAKGTALITGIPFRPDPAGPWYNSTVVLGTGEGRYYKQRLVPFGEYVPMEHWLRGIIAFFDLPMSHMSPGPSEQPPLTAGTWRIAPFICYEVVYPELVSREASAADLLLTVSNDSWFGRSIGPLQHFQMARMRALENGRYLLRGTNNGISAIIDHRGQVRARAPQYIATTLHGEAVPLAGRTPFNRAGNLPVLLGSLLVIAWSLRTRRSERARTM